MIDCHCHLNFNQDDGAKDFEESKKMIDLFIKNGVSKAILTTHFYPGKHPFNKNKYDENFDVLKTYIEKNRPDFSIYKGNEVFLDENTTKNFDSGNAYTLANSKYVLVELPFVGEVRYAYHYCYDLKLSGYKVILAHPERYRCFHKDLSSLRELLDLGVYLQLNLSSLKSSKSPEYKLAKLLLDSRMYSFAGSDSHTVEWRSPNVKPYLKTLKGLVDMNYLKELTLTNPDKIFSDTCVKRKYDYDTFETRMKKLKSGKSFIDRIKSIF